MKALAATVLAMALGAALLAAGLAAAFPPDHCVTISNRALQADLCISDARYQELLTIYATHP